MRVIAGPSTPAAALGRAPLDEATQDGDEVPGDPLLSAGAPASPVLVESLATVESSSSGFLPLFSLPDNTPLADSVLAEGQIAGDDVLPDWEEIVRDLPSLPDVPAGWLADIISSDNIWPSSPNMG